METGVRQIACFSSWAQDTQTKCTRDEVIMFENSILNDPTLRHCVVFLVQDRTDPETGRIMRVPCATAFVVAVQAESNGYWMTYLVTARHCFEASDKSRPLLVRVSTKSGGFVEVEVPADDWEQHPQTDVCIAPILFKNDQWVSFIPADLLLEHSEAESSSLREGHELTYISLFIQHHGKRKVLPLTRKAIIALMPHEKVLLKTGSMTHGEVDAYLVETHSWGGHSGSPVFTTFPGCINQINMKASPVRLLGVMTSHFEVPRQVEFFGDIIDGSSCGQVSEHSGISAVIPSQAILDLLMNDFVKSKREAAAAELQACLQKEGTPPTALDD